MHATRLTTIVPPLLYEIWHTRMPSRLVCSTIVLLAVAFAVASGHGSVLTRRGDDTSSSTTPNNPIPSSADEASKARDGETIVAGKLNAHKDEELHLSKSMWEHARDRAAGGSSKHSRFTLNQVEHAARAAFNAIQKQDPNYADLTRQISMPHQRDVIDDAKAELSGNRVVTQQVRGGITRETLVHARL